jgi:probable F420-dependent oxidoreductase
MIKGAMPPVRPFRFSLQVPRAASRREWVDLAQRAEDTGFDMVVTADHLGGLAPFIPLAVAAEATERLRVGTLVLNNDFYSPSLLARDAATLDLLSEGRFELGLGAGHARPEFERAGFAFEAPGRRVDRLEEAVGVLRRLFDGETVTHTGDHYSLREESIAPHPVQSRLPLLVGGGGDRVLTIAARLADAVGFTGLGRTLEDGHHHEPAGFAPWRVDEQVTRVRQAAGERLEDVELQVLVQAVVVTNDPVRAAEDLISDHLTTMNVDDVLATPYLMIGTVWELIDRLVERRERWGFSHYTVRPDALGQIEGVMAALVRR